eukprot:m.249835 g.249835  ORF g.249835 m.249835 type:complete len:123 (-) comp10974_c0_seq37:1358-1726(-)
MHMRIPALGTRPDPAVDDGCSGGAIRMGGSVPLGHKQRTPHTEMSESISAQQLHDKFAVLMKEILCIRTEDLDTLLRASGDSPNIHDGFSVQTRLLLPKRPPPKQPHNSRPLTDHCQLPPQR